LFTGHLFADDQSCYNIQYVCFRLVLSVVSWSIARSSNCCWTQYRPGPAHNVSLFILFYLFIYFYLLSAASLYATADNYSVAFVCVCVCAIKFCKQDMSHFAKFIAASSYVLHTIWQSLAVVVLVITAD